MQTINMPPIELFFVSITRLDTGNTMTEVYQSQQEAQYNFLQLCSMNKAEMKGVEIEEDGYWIYAEAYSRASYIRISFLQID
jgi:hypothetical protein